MCALEETILQGLSPGLRSHRLPKRLHGWYCTGPDEKIASIGVEIRRGIAYHGFSLYVDLKEDPTRFVVCCGIPVPYCISMKSTPYCSCPFAPREKTMASFAEVFGVSLEPRAPEVFF